MSERYQQQHRSSLRGHTSHSNATEHDTAGHERQHQHQQRPPPSQNQRRRQAAISLASFSTKKGHDRALQEYKKRKETKFQKNAALLREYQKVMKQEGYDAGRGASRKRTTDRPREEDGSDDEDAGTGRGGDNLTTAHSENKEPTTSEQSRKKRQKADPLHRARKEAERRKAEQLEAISQKQQRRQQEGKKLNDRKIRAKKMMQRTKRGQPLIKNVIGDLLEKIKSDVGK